MKIINSPITKALGVVVVVVGVIVFSSFSAQKSINETVSDYAAFQFQAAVRQVLKDDISPRLSNIEKQLAGISDLQQMQLADKYADIIRQINKNYEKMKKGDIDDITKANYDALGVWWGQLPESYKTDVLKSRFKSIVDYFSKIY